MVFLHLFTISVTLVELFRLFIAGYKLGLTVMRIKNDKTPEYSIYINLEDKRFST